MEYHMKQEEPRPGQRGLPPGREPRIEPRIEPSSLPPDLCRAMQAIPAAPMAMATGSEWVCCEKCDEWRVLPGGFDPAGLPEIWECGMVPLPHASCGQPEPAPAETMIIPLLLPASDRVQAGGSKRRAPAGGVGKGAAAKRAKG